MDSIDYDLDAEDPRNEQPQNITINLKPHQLASLHRMKALDCDCGMSMKSLGINIRSNVGVLADLAGYGKTITFLSLIEELKEKDTQWMPKAKTYITDGYGISLVHERQLPSYTSIDTTLIVVPENLVEHWAQHIDKYTSLTYETVDIENYNKIIIEDYDIVLCSSKNYNSFVHKHREYFWNRVAFDEADSINIPNTEYVSSRFLWLITATYHEIPKRKNKGFLKNLFKPKSYWDNPIKTHFLPVVVKGTDSFVKKSFELLEPSINYIECQTPGYIRAVHNHISPYILELMNAGDLNNAIIALGGNVNSDRNVINLVTREIKNKIKTTKAKIDVLDQLTISTTERETKRSNLLSKLETLQDKRRSLEDAINKASISDCCICYDVLNHPTIVSCCNNMFCAQCLLRWLDGNHICPLCRSTVDPNTLQTIDFEMDDSVVNKTRKKNIPKDKLTTLLDIISQDNENKKFLVFSGHNAAFKDIGDRLDSKNIQYGVLTSAMKTTDTLNKFSSGEVSVILLNTKHNGAGIEIPEATDIILYHQMPMNIELQAVARAQRPGRSNRLRVWKLKYDHEYTITRGPL